MTWILNSNCSHRTANETHVQYGARYTLRDEIEMILKTSAEEVSTDLYGKSVRCRAAGLLWWNTVSRALAYSESLRGA